MATERTAHFKWAQQQLHALLDLGIDLAEAERSVKWVLDHLPPGADPATWIPPAALLYQDPAGSASLADARVDWFADENVAPKWKRLLGAQQEMNRG